MASVIRWHYLFVFFLLISCGFLFSGFIIGVSYGLNQSTVIFSPKDGYQIVQILKLMENEKLDHAKYILEAELNSKVLGIWEIMNNNYTFSLDKEMKSLIEKNKVFIDSIVKYRKEKPFLQPNPFKKNNTNKHMAEIFSDAYEQSQDKIGEVLNYYSK